MTAALPQVSSSRVLRCDPAAITFDEGGTPVVSDTSTSRHLDAAAKALQEQRLVAFPTETVYGLGGSALASSQAIAQIFKTKGRPSDNPLIVHIASTTQLNDIVDPSERPFLPSCYAPLMSTFWPGPLTLLFPTIPGELVSEKVTCGLTTVGVRMPSHPVARALIAVSKLPLAAPSANTSGRPSPTAAEHVAQDLASKPEPAYILDGGQCTVGVESTVVSALSSKGKQKADEADEKEILRVLRLGGISPEQLQDCISKAGLADRVEVQLATGEGQSEASKAGSTFTPSTPGMKYKHYSPDAKVVLLQSSYSTQAKSLQDVLGPFQQKKIGIMSPSDSKLTTVMQDLPFKVLHFSLGDSADYATQAQRLFAGLRGLDEQAVDVILVETVPEEQLGRTIMERLRKAAGGAHPVPVQI